MAQMTEEQVLAAYVEKMGQELGTLFNTISGELSWLHWRWKQYRILFGEKPSRLDLLNESAPFFFRVIQDVLFEDTLLGIARLVGSPKSAGNSTLTIQRLPPLVGDPNLRDEVSVLIQNATTSAAFAVEWRHRRIAHRDLALALGTSTQVLEIATREKVEGALSALREVLNHIEGVYCNAHTAYYSPALGDAKSLLYVIRDGLLRERDRQAQWNNGERHDDDLAPLGEI